MPRKPETIFKERVLKDLRRLPFTWAEKIQQLAKRGTSDIFACVNGFCVVMELKKDAKEKPDKLQRHKLLACRSANGIALVVSPETWPRVLDFLSDITAFPAARSLLVTDSHLAQALYGEEL